MYEEENNESEFLNRQKKNPFQTPDGYFDSIEDRIMAKIKHPDKTETFSSKIIQLMKPILGLAASFLLISLLAYSLLEIFSIKKIQIAKTTQDSTFDMLDNYTFDLGLIDDNTLASAIFTDETSNVSATNPDELLAYLSSDLDDLEIYSEIQN